MKILYTAIGILLVLGFIKTYSSFRKKLPPNDTRDKLWNMPVKEQVKAFVVIFLIVFIPVLIFLLYIYSQWR